MTHVRLAVLVLAVVAGLPGCAINGLAFNADHRIEISQPLENSRVRLPLEVQWTATNVDGVFGVFFDRSPMRPNEPLLSLVDEDDPCRSQPTCPDVDWLANHGIYLTDQSRLLVDSLPDLRTTERADDRHDMSIVIIDGEGRRVGESAFYREFIVERED